MSKKVIREAVIVDGKLIGEISYYRGGGDIEALKESVQKEEERNE